MAMTVPDTATLKPAIVLGLLLVLLVAERWMPRRDNARGWRSQARNFSIGGLSTVCDRLFSTHVADPKDGHTAMRIGLEEFRSERDQSLLKQLALPFSKGTRVNPLEPS